MGHARDGRRRHVAALEIGDIVDVLEAWETANGRLLPFRTRADSPWHMPILQ